MSIERFSPLLLAYCKKLIYSSHLKSLSACGDRAFKKAIQIKWDHKGESTQGLMLGPSRKHYCDMIGYGKLLFSQDRSSKSMQVYSKSIHIPKLERETSTGTKLFGILILHFCKNCWNYEKLNFLLLNPLNLWHFLIATQAVRNFSI